jgi:signal transduction histidine kinase
MVRTEARLTISRRGGLSCSLSLGYGSGAPVTAQQRTDLERQRSQTYLLSLINDVLNFAKIESGHLSVELENVAVGELVAGTSDFVRPQLRECGLAFTAVPCAPHLHVRADRERCSRSCSTSSRTRSSSPPAAGRSR